MNRNPYNSMADNKEVIRCECGNWVKYKLGYVPVCRECGKQYVGDSWIEQKE